MLDEVRTETHTPPATKSFRDTLLQPKIKDKVFDCDIDDLSDEEDVSNQVDPSKAHGDELVPTQTLKGASVITFPKKLRARKQWENCLITELLGKSIGYKALTSEVVSN
ncbi:hypothetical protein U1Q18_052778 [Sarracenia purpurea var. burkii]